MFPWQTKYRIAKQEVSNAPWINQQVVSDQESGRRLFTMEPIKFAGWFELDIQPQGTTLFGDNPLIPDAVPTLDRVVSGPEVLKNWTPAKARVIYTLASGETRVVRFDIGSGVTVRLPPTNHVEVDLLVWSEEDLDEVIAPPTAAVLRGQVNFGTTVSCKATVVPFGSEIPKPRWVQVYYIPGNDVTNRQVQVPLENQVDAVQMYAAAIPPSAADLVIGDIAAGFRTEVTDQPRGLPDALSSAFPLAPIDFDTPHMSRRAEVPHSNANVVRVVMADPAKFANVFVMQEIF
jgi:hypothetical protein